MNAELVAIITEELAAHRFINKGPGYSPCEACDFKAETPGDQWAHQAEQIAARLGIEPPHDPFDAMFNPPLFRVRALERGDG